MSANNYILIHKVGEKYYIWYNLNAEKSVKNEVLTEKNVTKVFDTLDKAIKWANENDMTEYGYQVDNLHKPKDGYKEKIRVKQLWKI